jgi:hypothetical protein
MVKEDGALAIYYRCHWFVLTWASLSLPAAVLAPLDLRPFVALATPIFYETPVLATLCTGMLAGATGFLGWICGRTVFFGMSVMKARRS